MGRTPILAFIKLVSINHIILNQLNIQFSVLKTC